MGRTAIFSDRTSFYLSTSLSSWYLAYSATLPREPTTTSIWLYSWFSLEFSSNTQEAMTFLACLALLEGPYKRASFSFTSIFPNSLSPWLQHTHMQEYTCTNVWLLWSTGTYSTSGNWSWVQVKSQERFSQVISPPGQDQEPWRRFPWNPHSSFAIISYEFSSLVVPEKYHSSTSLGHVSQARFTS